MRHVLTYQPQEAPCVALNLSVADMPDSNGEYAIELTVMSTTQVPLRFFVNGMLTAEKLPKAKRHVVKVTVPTSI